MGGVISFLVIVVAVLAFGIWVGTTTIDLFNFLKKRK